MGDVEERGGALHEVSVAFQFREDTPMAEPKPTTTTTTTTFLVDDEQNSTPNQPHEIPGDDLYAFDFDPLSPPNISFFLPSSARSHNHSSYSDSDSESCCGSDANFAGENEEEDGEGEQIQINFVTDLFASRQEVFVVDDPDFDAYPFLDSVTHDVSFVGFAGGGEDAFGSSYDEELGLESGSRVEFHSGSLVSEFGESSASGGPNSSTDGLRIVGFDSDSDSEEVVNSGIWVDDSNSQRGDSGDLEWQDVEERVEEEEEEGLRSVIQRIEELSVSSEVSSNGVTSDIGEEIVRNLEWEVLLAVNNLNRGLEFDDDDDDDDGDGVSYLAVHDDYMYTIEYDSIFGQFVQNESALKGSPPAAKSVIENLPIVVLTKEENLVCAVCKDELLAEEKVTKLPCCHHYHGDCIVPWLGIRNTCPVCRYELPTDDGDYEQGKGGRREGDDPPSDLQVSYNLELLP